MPLVKALAEKNKDKQLKLGLMAMDIPISRQGINNMEQLAGKLGLEVVDRQGYTAGSGGRERRGCAHQLQAGPTMPPATRR